MLSGVVFALELSVALVLLGITGETASRALTVTTRTASQSQQRSFSEMTCSADPNTGIRNCTVFEYEHLVITRVLR